MPRAGRSRSPRAYRRDDGDARRAARRTQIEHPRLRFGERSIDYRHYLTELARKPQAVRQVLPAVPGSVLGQSRDGCGSATAGARTRCVVACVAQSLRLVSVCAWPVPSVVALVRSWSAGMPFTYALDGTRPRLVLLRGRGEVSLVLWAHANVPGERSGCLRSGTLPST